MQVATLLTDHHVALVHDWLTERSELMMRIELPHSGGSGDTHWIRTLTELREVLDSISHPEVEVMIFRTLTTDDDDEFDSCMELEWIYQHPESVLYVALRKNRLVHDRYAADPVSYQSALAQWSDR